MSEIPNPIYRLFRISDSEMLQDSTTTETLLEADMADFTAFDATITPAFANDWLTAIGVAQSQPTDELYRDRIMQRTQNVQNAMALCRKKYNDVKYYVKKAFPNNLAVQKEFGLDDYDSARKSDIKLMEFMLRMHTVATTYNAELTAPTVGYTQPQIDEIETLANSLGADNNNQEVYIKGQLTTTQQRVSSMNAVWQFRTQIAEAAKIIYENNFAKYQQYLLPDTSSNAQDYAILGIVSNGADNTPIVGARVRIEALNFEVFTNSLGKYGIADNIPPATYTLDIEALDYQPKQAEITVINADETITLNVSLEAN